MTEQASTYDLSLLRLCRWATSYALRRWIPLIGVVASLLLKVGLDVLKPWPTVLLIDYLDHVRNGRAMPAIAENILQHLPGGTTPESLIAWSVGATIIIFLLSWAAGVLTAYANISLGQRMTYDLAGDLFSKLQELSLHFHARKSVGDNIRRVTSDCTCAAVIVKDALLPVFSSAVSLVAMFAILWRIDSSLASLSLAVVPYMALVFWRYAQPMMNLSYAQQEAEGKIYEVAEQTFSAIPVVQAFGREEFNKRWFAGVTRESIAATLSLTSVQMRFKIMLGMATALGTAGILWVGSQHFFAGHLSVGSIVAFLSYLGALYAPLEAIMYTNSTIQGAAGSARRVLEVLRTKTTVADNSTAVTLNSPRGEVQIENVTFGYEQGRPVLKNISLAVSPGETIALVGATGAGKSTLVSLIPRFFDPWEGRVLVDGKDVRYVKLKSLRNNIALVLQDPFLFPMSIAENIAYGCPHASPEEIESAARAANAHEFILRLPDGYQTVIGERGATLSGGERQRLSIARALLKNAPILILDEPTSALDAESEALLLQALGRLKEGRATFIIAHRLSTVRHATRIVVLKQGAIVETGSHEELLRLGGIYTNLYQLQFESAKESAS
jgi:ATP-binding cassette, subfamily B, bacterial